MVRLVFDYNVLGFFRWCRKRLRLIGVEVLRPPRGVLYHDPLLAEYAWRFDAIVVTKDKMFPYRRKIVLLSNKYEKMWVELCRGISFYRGNRGFEPGGR